MGPHVPFQFHQMQQGIEAIQRSQLELQGKELELRRQSQEMDYELRRRAQDAELELRRYALDRAHDNETRGEAEPEQPADVASDEPQMTGERAVVIMRDDHPDEWCDGRGILDDFGRRGWIGDRDPALLIQSLRHSLRRLADSHPQIERKTVNGKHLYRYVTHFEAGVLIPVAHINGAVHPALSGGQR